MFDLKKISPGSRADSMARRCRGGRKYGVVQC